MTTQTAVETGADTASATSSATERAGFATGRVHRTLSLALSLAALILLALNLPTAIAQAAVLSWGWVAFSIVAAGGPALVLLALSRVATARILHITWSVSAGLLLIAYATAPLALRGATLTAADGVPWLVQLAVLAGCSAALAWRARYAIVYGVVLQVVLFNLVRFVDEPFPGQAMGETVSQLFIVTFFTCLAFGLRRAGVLLDETIASAVTEAQASSAAESRRTARQRFEMLVHDRVITALLSYASGARADQAAAEASGALAAIAAARSVAAPTEMTPIGLVWELQALTTRLDPEAQFENEVDSVVPIPADVSEALVNATSEALRNSIRHAPTDRAVARQVRVEISDALVELAVLDDGTGFNARSVSAARLGIRSGIEGRMRAIAGGEAAVSSRVGYGTTVILSWRRS